MAPTAIPRRQFGRESPVVPLAGPASVLSGRGLHPTSSILAVDGFVESYAASRTPGVAKVVLADRALYRKLFWPTLAAIQELGGSATRQEVLSKVASPFTDDEQAETMPNGRTSRLRYYTSWNLTRLIRVGVVDNSRQGVCALSERGRAIAEADIDALWEEMRAAYRTLRQERQSTRPGLGRRLASRCARP